MKTRPSSHPLSRLVLFASLAIFGGLAPRAVAQSDPTLQLALGNPSGATTSVSNVHNYLISRPQYAVGYDRDTAIPKWVSWHLGPQDLGSATRTTTFSTDTSLPSGWYRATSNDYTNTGFDRGHNCPSADRTATATDNKALFLMTNIMPQAPDNNQGPWEQLETYCRDLVNSGDELYIITSNDGTRGTIASGKINVPAYIQKVIVVLPLGSNDLSRITTSTRIIAVDMPNVDGIRSSTWQSYRVSVDHCEQYTGLNYLSNVPTAIQSVLEGRVDNQ